MDDQTNIKNKVIKNQTKLIYTVQAGKKLERPNLYTGNL